MKKVLIIIKREYLVRVRTRAFILGTIISPLFLLGVIILPGFLAGRGGGGQRQITVLDQTGDSRLFDAIKDRLETHVLRPDSNEENEFGGVTQFVLTRQIVPPDQNPNDSIRRASTGGDDKGSEKAYLILGPGVLGDGAPEYHAKNLSDFSIRALGESVAAAISERKLMQAGF